MKSVERNVFTYKKAIRTALEIGEIQLDMGYCGHRADK